MKQTIGTIFMAAALAAALAGCGGNGTTGEAPAGGPRVPGVMGEVTAVDGSTVTIRNQRSQDQGTVSVTLADSTQIFKQAAITIDQIPVGESVSATGKQDGDVFTATRLQVGQALGFGGARPDGAPPQGDAPQGEPPQGGDQSNGRQPPPDGAPGQGRGDRITGTVTQVSGDTITIKTSSDATVQVRLGADAQIVQQVAGTRADITPGVQVMVTGEQTDSTLNATQIVVMPAIAPQQ